MTDDDELDAGAIAPRVSRKVLFTKSFDVRSRGLPKRYPQSYIDLDWIPDDDGESIMPEMTTTSLLAETTTILKRVRSILNEGAAITPGTTLARDLDQLLSRIATRLENDRGPYRDVMPGERS